MSTRFFFASLLSIVLVAAAAGARLAHGRPAPSEVTIGDGTAASCESEGAAIAFDVAVSAGGEINFNCGPEPVQIHVNGSSVGEEVTVNGNNLITLTGDDLRQLFFVAGGGILVLNDLTLQDGRGYDGGAIFIGPESAVTINRSRLTGNSADRGGAIYNEGYILIEESSLSDNSAGSGGAIFNTSCDSESCVGGFALIIDTTIAYNSAGWGGGIYNIDAAAHIKNSTISGNSASSFGGGIENAFGAVTLTNSTIAGNAAQMAGGLLVDDFSSVTLNNTIIADSKSGDCLSGDAVDFSASHTLIEDSENACGVSSGLSGNITGQDPRLEPLADNGGPTKTHALPANSPAVDAGDNSLASELPYDQRGQGYPRVVGTVVDMGAFESDLKVVPLLPRAYLPSVLAS